MKGILTFTVVSVAFVCANAQVIIGSLDEPQSFSILELISDGRLGLRLPQLDSNQRDAITDAAFEANPKSHGLMIYNTTTDCVETWNGTTKRWVSLCGSDDSGFVQSCSTSGDFAAAGGSSSCSISDPSCKQGGDYSFSFIIGAEYAQLNVTDAGEGKFTLTIDPNDRASSRSVIILVTSPCGKSQTFVYHQDGDTSGCNPATAAPKIKGENSTALCAGGAVYLYLDGRPTGTYIWTRNGVQVGTGDELIATQSGKYIVYADKIGCTTVKPDTLVISVGSTAAPQPVVSIVAENNGNLCAATETVQIFATKSGAGTIHWYKDNIRQTSLTDSPITAGEGEWFAVVENGGCSSTPSNKIIVQLDPNAGAVSTSVPTFTVNGQSVADALSVCSGGTLNLAVAAPVADETYTWYKDNTLLGQGETFSFNIGAAAGSFVLRCRATGANACAKEASAQTFIALDSAPVTPSISVNTPGDAICGGSATLTANSSAATSYNWYRADTENGDYTEISGESAQTLVISQTGFYKVEAINGSCVSARSKAKNIAYNSGAAVATITGPATVNAGRTKTYSVEIDNPQDATFSWTVNPGTTGATPTSGTGSDITIYFADEGTATISLEAQNACGTAAITNNDYPVTVLPACNSAVILSHSPATKSASLISGNTTTLSISADGSPTLSYEWYKTVSAVASGGTKVGTDAPSYTTPLDLTAGTYYYYCKVRSSCDYVAAVSDIFTVTVTDLAAMPVGSGTFSGRICFDLAQTDSGGCGPVADRQTDILNAYGALTDFSDPTTNTQTYTFTPSGTVSNVRFAYKEADGHSGDIIASISGDNTGDNISSPVACTVVYKDDLNTTVNGVKSENAWTTDIYVIYNDASDGTGADHKLQLTTYVKDCSCCGAFTDAGTWLTFMCYNLGADDATRVTPQQLMDATPTTVYGAFYQFGLTTAWNNYEAVPSGWSRTGGNSDSTAWGYNTVKNTTYDPCPDGWRVPSSEQWKSIFKDNIENAQSYNFSEATANTWTWKDGGTTAGVMIGKFLFLPAAGLRTINITPWLTGQSSEVAYWSNTWTSAKIHYYLSEKSLSSFQMYLGTTDYKGLGLPIRCVVDN
jgi:uncharacterized protein (TIGR02145 family)